MQTCEVGGAPMTIRGAPMTIGGPPMTTVGPPMTRILHQIPPPMTFYVLIPNSEIEGPLLIILPHCYDRPHPDRTVPKHLHVGTTVCRQQLHGRIFEHAAKCLLAPRAYPSGVTTAPGRKQQRTQAQCCLLQLGESCEPSS